MSTKITGSSFSIMTGGSTNFKHSGRFDLEKEKAIRDFILENGWLNKVETVNFLAQGEYNENYTVVSDSKKYVFRINHGSQLRIDNQIEYEYLALKALENSDVTPHAFFYKLDAPGFDRGILLMEFLEGIPLDYKKDAHRAALVFALVHSQPVTPNFIIQKNPFADIAKESYYMLKRYNYEDYSVVRKMLLDYHEKMAAFSQNADKYFAEESVCIVNTEVNSHNFIINDGRQYLVDWEKSVVSYRYQDLAHFLVPTTTLWKSDYVYSKEEKKNFIEKYNGALGERFGTDELLEKTLAVERVILLRALSWCYMAYYEYTHQDRSLRNNDTFKKIKQYLDGAECFLR